MVDINERLMEAAKRGYEAKLKALLREPGCNALGKDFEDWTALMHAAYGGHDACVRILIPVSDAPAKTKTGQTALMWAAGCGYEACVRLLLPVSDASSADTEGRTPLMWAACAGREDCLRILLPVSDVQARDSKGLTASYSARSHGNESVAQFIEDYAFAQIEHAAIEAAASAGVPRNRAAPRV